jgi:hypothetical protein
MKKFSILSLLLSLPIILPFSLALSFSAYADISRSAFIEQLDSANCTQVPPEIYLDTQKAHFDFANALSLSWISLTTLGENSISAEEFEQQWQLRNLEIIDNPETNLRILLADYKDTMLITYRYTDSNKEWLYNSDGTSDDFEHSFTLGEKTHHGFSQVLSSEWASLLASVRARKGQSNKLWVFGHSLAGALAQLSAAGFEQEGIHVDQVYLSGSPKVGSPKWVEKAQVLLANRVHRVVYEQDLIARLPVNQQALNEFKSISSIAPDFIANSMNEANSLMNFDTLGRQISLDHYANYVEWNESDSVSLEQIYWLNLADDLSIAKHASLSPLDQINNMASVISANTEDHSQLKDDGYFCAMIAALENEH